MLAQLAYMLLALQAPAAPQGQGGLRIVAVEQAGGPPYAPREGRVYRLGGGSISDVRVGELLIVRRPGEVRDLGLLRVVSVHGENFAANSALAKLESRGETFPLKGDAADRLSPARVPPIGGLGAHGLKGPPPPPLNPLLMPGVPALGGAAGSAADGSLGPGPPSPAAAAAPPAHTAPRPPGMPGLFERRPIYFLKGSAEVSPKGAAKLKEWVGAWGREGLTYFLAVPYDQMRMQRLTVDRLAALQGELGRHGVGSVELRSGEAGGPGPYDVVYVGAEGPAL